MSITVHAHLPPGTKGVAYEKNSHWIELVDEEGNRIHLPATGLMQYRCGKCGETWFRTSNYGDRPCPECAEIVTPSWRVPQLSFVPSAPSDFKPPKQKGPA